MTTNYYKIPKKNFKREHVQDIEILLQKKKKKSNSIIVNVIKIFLNAKIP